MDSLLPLHKQLASHFSRINVLLIIVVTLLCYLIYAREVEVELFTKSTIPALERQTALHYESWKNVRLFKDIVDSTHGTNLLKSHQQLIANIEQLRQLTPVGSRQYSLLKMRLEKQEPLVERLSENVSRNGLLRRSSLIQLQLVRDELQRALDDSKPELTKLLEQITRDRVSDKVTVSRAKAHVTLAKKVELIETTLTNVIDAQVLFDRLNLQISLEEFNYINNKLYDKLVAWTKDFREQPVDNSQTDTLLTMLNTLQLLLYDEQNTVAKWRGHIRVAQDYFEQLLQEQKSVEELLLRVKPAKIETVSFPGAIGKVLQPYKQYSVTTYLSFTLVFVVVFLAAILMIVRKVQSRLIKHSADVSKVVKQASDGEKIPEEQLHSEELTIIAEEFSQAIKPEHSERDYQKVAQQLDALHLFFSDNANVAKFIISKDSNLLSTHAAKIVFRGAPNKSTAWLDAFDNSNKRIILACAKQAKSSGEANSCLCSTRWDSLLTMNIEFVDGHWQGTIKAQKELAEIRINFQDEKDNWTLEKNVSLVSHLAQLKELKKTVLRAMLQSTNTQKSQEEHYSQIYRHLEGLYQWCIQAETIENTEQSYELADVSLSVMFQSVAHNVMVGQKSHSNRVLLDIDSDVGPKINIAQRQFCQCLIEIGKLALQEQVSATMAIKVNVLDVNPGQQVLSITFDVHQKSPNNRIPHIMSLLANIDVEDNDLPMSIQFIRQLYSSLHGQQISVVESSQGFVVNTAIPVALLDKGKLEPILEIDLQQQHVYILTNKGLLGETLKQQIIDVNGIVELCHSAEHLIDLLTTKHLKKHPATSVIVSPQWQKKSRQAIEQHVASLGKKLAPKIFYLNQYIGQKLSDAGLYSASDACFVASSFQQQFSDFIASSNSTNIVAEDSVFKQHQFRETKVKILLVSQNIEQHTNLIGVLHWLGLQVHIETQPEIAEMLWQSGCYLVLLTDQKISANVEMQVGKQLTRGVYSINDQSADIIDKDSMGHWHTGTLATIDQLETLIEQLSPWLLPLPSLELIEAKSEVAQRDVEKEASSLAKKQNFIELELTPAIESDDILAPFDLEQYANNQGSPELAVFMLDEYLDDIDSSVTEIEKALASKDFKMALEQVETLILSCSILTATDLLSEAQSLKLALENKATKKAQYFIKNIMRLKQVLVDFCVAI